MIFVTLLLNAGAILNYKLDPLSPYSSSDVGFGSLDDAGGIKAPMEDKSVAGKLRRVLKSLKSLRVLLGVWNIVVILLMLTFFT